LFSIQNGQLHVDHRFMKRKFQKLLSVFSKEDIAYALQETIEDVIIRLIKSILPDVDSDSHPDLFLAGGLFANVRVNQKLNQTGYFQNVFVNPCMNDGGTAFCALHRTNGEQYKTSRSITHMFLGPRYNDYQIRNVLNAFDVSYRYEKDIEATIADLLSQGYAVARFAGSMEFGPRALGNRSILCATNDVTVQKWLNEKLGRDDFMPFAAVTLDEYKNDCYTRLENASYLYPFMTSTFYCTSMMKIQSPNVVHVDETVRAQIVTKENNPSLYRILSLYYSKTNIPSLLNTSFNLHGEPIVCTPRDALNTFHTLKLDYLVMENYIIKN
ncbi:MAG: carbamoyltransferase, partial [Candidatus Omnitrophica bacterium]|nr:carbamoyltransferase [Candidatus Omnitrophota bacterium]